MSSGFPSIETWSPRGNTDNHPKRIHKFYIYPIPRPTIPAPQWSGPKCWSFTGIPTPIFKGHEHWLTDHQGEPGSWSARLPALQTHPAPGMRINYYRRKREEVSTSQKYVSMQITLLTSQKKSRDQNKAKPCINNGGTTFLLEETGFCKDIKSCPNLANRPQAKSRENFREIWRADCKICVERKWARKAKESSERADRAWACGCSLQLFLSPTLTTAVKTVRCEDSGRYVLRADAQKRHTGPAKFVYDKGILTKKWKKTWSCSTAQVGFRLPRRAF